MTVLSYFVPVFGGVQAGAPRRERPNQERLAESFFGGPKRRGRASPRASSGHRGSPKANKK
eukprot:6764053-Pyramimonas_sp.AAC.1